MDDYTQEGVLVDRILCCHLLDRALLTHCNGHIGSLTGYDTGSHTRAIVDTQLRVTRNTPAPVGVRRRYDLTVGCLEAVSYLSAIALPGNQLS
ncbi:hypothetical protein MBAV_000278, partial [Candidatus Magnetobacterium bavaricum]